MDARSRSCLVSVCIGLNGLDVVVVDELGVDGRLQELVDFESDKQFPSDINVCRFFAVVGEEVEFACDTNGLASELVVVNHSDVSTIFRPHVFAGVHAKCRHVGKTVVEHECGFRRDRRNEGVERFGWLVVHTDGANEIGRSHECGNHIAVVRVVETVGELGLELQHGRIIPMFSRFLSVF